MEHLCTIRWSISAWQHLLLASPLHLRGNAHNQYSQNPLPRWFLFSFCKTEVLLRMKGKREESIIIWYSWDHQYQIFFISGVHWSQPAPVLQAARIRDGASPVMPEPSYYLRWTLWCPPHVPSSRMINTSPGFGWLTAVSLTGNCPPSWVKPYPSLCPLQRMVSA